MTQYRSGDDEAPEIVTLAETNIFSNPVAEAKRDQVMVVRKDAGVTAY